LYNKCNTEVIRIGSKETKFGYLDRKSKLAILDEEEIMSKKVFDLIKKEAVRQKTGLEMIPSENYVSEEVLKALGSILTNKYSEGFAGRRYYGGNEVIDLIENYACELAN